MLHSIAEGLRAVRNDPPLLSLMIVIATINICISGPIGVGLAAVAKFRFGSAAAFGTFLSCFSGGMLVGMLAGGMVKRPRRRGLQFIIMSGLCGLELIAIGLLLKFAAIVALLALMGLGVGFVNVQFAAWTQMRVERALLGRVMSVMMFSAVGLVPISYAAAGVLANWSLPALFVIAGAVLAATSDAGGHRQGGARDRLRGPENLLSSPREPGQPLAGSGEPPKVTGGSSTGSGEPPKVTGGSLAGHFTNEDYKQST